MGAGILRRRQDDIGKLMGIAVRMLPKTICYILMLVSFLRRNSGKETEEAKA